MIVAIWKSPAVDKLKFGWLAFPAGQLLLAVVQSFVKQWSVEQVEHYSRYSGYWYDTVYTINNFWYVLEALQMCLLAFGTVCLIMLVFQKKEFAPRYVFLAAILAAVAEGLMVGVFGLNMTACPFNGLVIQYAGVVLWAMMLYFWVFVCNEFRTAAADKGYEGRRFFWLPFFMVGIPLVIALPNKRLNNTMQEMLKKLSDAQQPAADTASIEKLQQVTPSQSE